MKQHEILCRGHLHDERGLLREPGWSRYPYLQYDRKRIRSPKYRIKEWDYYAVYSYTHNLWVTTTFSDLGYAGLFAIAVVDGKTGKWAQSDALSVLPLGRHGLSPHSGDYDVGWANNVLRIAYSRQGEVRRILAGAPDLTLAGHNTGVDLDITLIQVPQQESVNIATNWKENRKAFYLNEKINPMGASGTVRIGDQTFELTPDTALGVLDWGRGVWTYRNRWYWASASGFQDGVPYGFNFGYGFSDRSVASENAIIYNERIHKIGEVSFDIPSESYLDEWKITDDQGRVELTFHPVADRTSSTNLLAVRSDQHQVFGFFEGILILDEDIRLPVTRLAGFAENVYNRY